MLQSPTLELLEKRAFLAISGLLVFALYLNLGIYPLTLEEPRRGLIALEMIFSENWIVPTQNGELYFRKPPVYNWLLIFSYKIFGDYSELATRFFSVTSFIAMAWIFFKFCKSHFNERLAAYSALFFLVSVDILFYFSALGEIDLFYSLVTLSVFVVIYNYGEREDYYKLFIWAYGLSAIGFLTKGLSSLPFLGITLLVYFISKKNFKKLFSIPHLTGVVTFVLIAGGYFYAYAQYEDVTGWWSTLFSESSEKAVGGSFVSLLKHLLLFPIDTLKNLLPATFFVPFLFRKDLVKKIREQPLMSYFVLTFFANFILYWISTGGRSRYIYALFPLMIAVFIYFLLTSEVSWKTNYLRVLGIVIIALTLLGLTASNFVAQFEVVDYLIVKSIGLISATVLILFVFLRQQKLRLLMIIACFVIMRLGFSFITPVVRAESSGARLDKAAGIDVAKITKGKPLYLYSETQISRSTTFYIEAGREATLDRRYDFDKAGFWICTAKDTTATELLKSFSYRQNTVYLIRK